MKSSIAMVDDDSDILSFLNLLLKKECYAVKDFEDGKSFFSYLNKERPDVLILDLSLPDGDENEICKSIRKNDSLSEIYRR